MDLKNTILNEMANQLNESKATTSQLETLLKKHDWYYNYSDDGRKYKAGSARYEEIIRVLRELYSTGTKKAKLTSIWKKHAPKDYANGMPNLVMHTPDKSDGGWN